MYRVESAARRERWGGMRNLMSNIRCGERGWEKEKNERRK